MQLLSPRTPISAPSPKRDRSPRHDDTPDPDLYDLHYQVEDADDEDSGQPLPKKRRYASRQSDRAEVRNNLLKGVQGQRASKGRQQAADNVSKQTGNAKKLKAKKKPPQRLPVDELVMMSERMNDLELEIAEGELAVTDSRSASSHNKMTKTADIDFLDIMELSQDPISQLSTPGTSTDDTESGNRRPITKIKMKINHRKGFERIDLREYRMPKVPHASPRTKRRQQRTASHSDGFEGKEALPIGRLMPVKQHSRRKTTTQKHTVHIGELTILAEKESCGSTPERRERRQTGHQRRNKKNQSRSSAQEALRGEDSMPIDGGDQQAADESSVQPREEVPSVARGASTPKITTADNSMFELPTDSSSPLKRKAQRASQAALGEKVDGQENQNVAPPPRVLLIHNESGEETVSQQLKQVVAKKRTPKRSNLSDLEVSQQLMMVSIKKPPRQMRQDSDGSGGSDSGCPREGKTFSSNDSEENNVSEHEEEIEDEVEVEGNDLILEEEADQGGRVETNGALQGKEDNDVMPEEEPC